MGWRFWCGVGILGVFLALGLWINGRMEHLHEPVCEHLEQAAQAADMGDKEQAAARLNQAKNIWQRWRQLTMSAADHRAVEEIDGIFDQVESYLKTGNLADIAAWCRRLRRLVAAVGDIHSLTVENLL